MSLTAKEEVMSGKHDVYVLEVDGELRVRPAVAIVDGGAGVKLRIRNLTQYPAFLGFPSGPLAPGQPQTQLVEPKNTIGPGGKLDRVQLPIDPSSDGDYNYHVFVIKDGTVVSALGDSGPKIIVDP